jgi:hypothetical protein
MAQTAATPFSFHLRRIRDTMRLNPLQDTPFAPDDYELSRDPHREPTVDKAADGPRRFLRLEESGGRILHVLSILISRETC